MTDAEVVAAVDCGTNSTRLLIVDGAGRTEVREIIITRLGQGVDESRTLRPEAVERTLGVLTHFRELLDTHGAESTRVVATSAVRRRGQRRAVPALGFTLPIGVEAEVLPGDEEGAPSSWAPRPIWPWRWRRSSGARHRWWLDRDRNGVGRRDLGRLHEPGLCPADRTMPPSRSADGGRGSAAVEVIARAERARASWPRSSRTCPRLAVSSGWPARCRPWRRWTSAWPTMTGTRSITTCCPSTRWSDGAATSEKRRTANARQPAGNVRREDKM